MAAIEGFESVIDTGDVVVSKGMVNGVAIAGAALDTSAEAPGDGIALIVVRAGVLDMVALAARVASDVVVGSCSVTSAVASAPSFAYRGSDIPASA